jgi:hypothetical protein
MMDGVEYRMVPLSDLIVGELDNWIRSSIVRVARIAAKLESSSVERDAIMESAFRIATRVSWFTEGSSLWRTVDGAAQTIWHTVRQNHPDLTPEDLSAAIRRDPGGLSDALNVFTLLNPMQDAKKKTEPTVPTDTTQTKEPFTEPSAQDTDGHPTSSPE